MPNRTSLLIRELLWGAPDVAEELPRAGNPTVLEPRGGDAADMDDADDADEEEYAGLPRACPWRPMTRLQTVQCQPTTATATQTMRWYPLKPLQTIVMMQSQEEQEEL